MSTQQPPPPVQGQQHHLQRLETAFVREAPPLDPGDWRRRSYDDADIVNAHHGGYSIFRDQQREVWTCWTVTNGPPLLLTEAPRIADAVRACRVHWRALAAIDRNVPEGDLFKPGLIHGSEPAPAPASGPDEPPA